MGGEGWEGRKVEPRKQGRLVGVSSVCWRFGPPKLGMENKLFLFVFFEKEDFLVFDCWGEAVIGKKKRGRNCGFHAGKCLRPRWDGG